MASRLGILFQPWQRATLSDAESTTTVAIAIGFGFVLIMASYDPVRYVIVVDASIITLLAFVAVALYSIVTFGFDATYPSPPSWYHLSWIGTVMSAVGAIVLIALRPRGRSKERDV